MMSDQDDYTEESNKNDSHEQAITSINVSNFPAKLHFMLNDLKRDGLEYIASWQEHGRCFIVRKPKEFEIKILPCYFQQSKLTSFQRQLSFYGFRRIVTGRDKGCYFHEHFLRGKEELSLMILRTRIKGTGPRKPNSMEAPVPNFYEMPFCLHENTKNNINQGISEKEQQESPLKQVAKEDITYTNENNSQISSIKTDEVNINERVVTSFLKRNDDYEDGLNPLQLLNELESNPLSRHTPSSIKNLIQSRASSQALLSNLKNIGGGHHIINRLDYLQSMGLSSNRVSCNNYQILNDRSIFPSQSLFGLTYHPLAVSASSYFPLSSSYNRTSESTLPFSTGGVTPPSATSSDVIRPALANYFQQKSLGSFFG